MAVTDNEILAPFQIKGAVQNSDFALLHIANGNTTGKVTMEVLRAYLNAGFAISVNEQGYLVIGGQATQTKVAGSVIRIGENGFEISNDLGSTFIPLISFNQLVNNGIVYCTEEYYEGLVENDLVDENKLYMTYEE